MIQRKQTLYLLAAAVLMAITLLMPLATYFGREGSEYVLKGLGVFELIDAVHPSPVFTTLYLAVLLALSALLPLVIIFLFKKRFLQVRLCFAETVLLLGAQGFIAYHIYNLYKSVDVASWKFGVPSIFPILALVFVILAIRAIIRDHNLIKSLNRIR